MGISRPGAARADPPVGGLELASFHLYQQERRFYLELELAVELVPLSPNQRLRRLVPAPRQVVRYGRPDQSVGRPACAKAMTRRVLGRLETCGRGLRPAERRGEPTNQRGRGPGDLIHIAEVDRHLASLSKGCEARLDIATASPDTSRVAPAPGSRPPSRPPRGRQRAPLHRGRRLRADDRARRGSGRVRKGPTSGRPKVDQRVPGGRPRGTRGARSQRRRPPSCSDRAARGAARIASGQWRRRHRPMASWM